MRLAINGYGRIGRCVLRAASQRSDCATLDIVAINELASADAIHYLTRYDSTHGRFPGEVKATPGALEITGAQNSYQLALSAEETLAEGRWKDVDLVLDCTGFYNTLSEAQLHIDAGARRVLLSYPGEPEVPAIVAGVNDGQISKDHTILSAASCTSNALIPCLSVLHESFGVQQGVVTTIHASMHDQPVIDAYHSEDLRKNRAASQSVIPVATELAAGVARVMPELQGRLIAHALRVPVNNVSALNITLQLESTVSAEQVNIKLQQAAEGRLSGILGFTTEKLASCDFTADSRSGIVDGLQTDVVGGDTVNLLVWFDNEWAFANRMLDLALAVDKIA